MPIFPYNDRFHIALVTTVKSEHDIDQFGKLIPHFEKFLKYRIELNE